MTTTISDMYTLDPTNTTQIPSVTIPPEKQERDFWIGLFLALGSSGFNGVSFICQKLGLLSMAKKEGGVRASDGGHKYLLEWKWWLGMLSMAAGETLNFVAFIFAPASLVIPLGALSVIASAVLASYFLKERLNLLGKVGCCLCLIGSTLVVLNSPKTAEVENMDELLQKVQQPAVLVLAGVIYITAFFAIFYLAPRYGSTNVVVYVFICSSLGALTVMGAKGLGVAIRETFAGRNEFTNWLTYVMLAVLVFDIMFQINYLNKALDTFNTAVVTPTYYVMFTSSVLIFSAVLLQEFGSMTVEEIIGGLCGFLTIVVGIFILNVFKDMDISLRNLPKAKKESGDKAEAADGKGSYVFVPMHDYCEIFEYDVNLSDEEAEALIGTSIGSPVLRSEHAGNMDNDPYTNMSKGNERSAYVSNDIANSTYMSKESLSNGYENPAYVSIGDESVNFNRVDYNSDLESTNF